MARVQVKIHWPGSGEARAIYSELRGESLLEGINPEGNHSCKKQEMRWEGESKSRWHE